MKMHQSRIHSLNAEGHDCTVAELLLSEAFSEWLFSTKFWSDINSEHGTIFDQYEEDEASTSVAVSVAEALEKKSSILKKKDFESVSFIYGWTANRETPYIGEISKNQLLKEIEDFRLFLRNAVEKNDLIHFLL